MATFGISPVSGFPPPSSDEFPQFIQFQADGVDLGAPDVDTVNFANGVIATRGTGENAAVVTVAVESVPTVDVPANTVYAGPASGADAPPSFRVLSRADLLPFAWRRPSAGAVTLVLTDSENGVVVNGGPVTIPPNSSVAFPDGASILLQDAGYASPFSILEGAGVTVNVRAALLPVSAGQFALVTLIQQGIDNWIAAGDLELA